MPAGLVPGITGVTAVVGGFVVVPGPVPDAHGMLADAPMPGVAPDELPGVIIPGIDDPLTAPPGAAEPPLVPVETAGAVVAPAAEPGATMPPGVEAPGIGDADGPVGLPPDGFVLEPVVAPGMDGGGAMLPPGAAPVIGVHGTPGTDVGAVPRWSRPGVGFVPGCWVGLLGCVAPGGVPEPCEFCARAVGIAATMPTANPIAVICVLLSMCVLLILEDT
ncbi:MAG: hypothetical protein ABUS56_02595, partial [Acidobacteriota bacterium]